MRLCRILLLTIILCLTASPAAAYTITEFCADGYAEGDGDEYFVLDGKGSLASWSVTDGEGTVSFGGESLAKNLQYRFVLLLRFLQTLS